MQKGHPSGWPFRFEIMSGSVLLSHGETPHYHRRYGVSLLSSAWGQVGPPRYRRQAYSVLFQPLSDSKSPQPLEPISEQAEICLSSVFRLLFAVFRHQNPFGVVRLSRSAH